MNGGGVEHPPYLRPLDPSYDPIKGFLEIVDFNLWEK